MCSISIILKSFIFGSFSIKYLEAGPTAKITEIPVTPNILSLASSLIIGLNPIYEMSLPGDVYRRLRAFVRDNPSRFSWVDDYVAGSSRPMTLEQLKWIKEQEIEVIISLTENPLPEEWVKGLGFRYFHLPIMDHSAPSPETLKRIIDLMLKEIKEGKKILVHCAAGLGRTGTVLAAYFIARKQLSAEEAMKLVRKLRPGSIESIQERSIREFYQRYFG